MIAATLRHRHCSWVSLEARRWRGRSRILLLSKASLGAPGTRPITSTSYCVCSSLLLLFLLIFLLYALSAPSLLSSLVCLSLTSTTRHTVTTKKIARRREWRSKRRMDILLSCLHLSPIHPQYPFLRRKHRYIVGNISEYERDIVYSPFKRRLSISTFGFFQEENCFAMNVARGSLRMNTLS